MGVSEIVETPGNSFKGWRNGNGTSLPKSYTIRSYKQRRTKVSRAPRTRCSKPCWRYWTEEFATSLAKAWTSLFKSWQGIATKRVVAHFYLGDCAARSDLTLRASLRPLTHLMLWFTRECKSCPSKRTMSCQSQRCICICGADFRRINCRPDMLAEKFPYEGSIA